MQSYKISKLQLLNFRNLQSDVIEFGPTINCILGENGNGKTNILEAVYVLATRKSFRKNTGFPQYLGIDGDSQEIVFNSVFDHEKEPSIAYTGKIQNKGSQWFFNGKPTKKKLDIGIIFINPFDSYSFHNIPAQRRSWFDQHIGMLDNSYKSNLSKYMGALRFRNTLLSKKPSNYLRQIEAVDIDLATYSVELTKRRQHFLVEVADFCTETFQKIFSEEHILKIVLDSRIGGLDKTDVYDLLQNRIERDCAAGHTTYGIHKDDYTLLFDGLNSFDFCSLGQQKMSYLSLLFAYIELFRYKFNSFPIVLIDDVSGELDRFRWQRLVKYLETSKFQVLISTANENFREELEQIEGVNKLEVVLGSVKRVLN